MFLLLFRCGGMRFINVWLQHRKAAFCIRVKKCHLSQAALKARGSASCNQKQRKQCRDGPFEREVCLIPQVMIETVDSFQGKQLDVVMLSCVRAAKKHAKTNGEQAVRVYPCQLSFCVGPLSISTKSRVANGSWEVRPGLHSQGRFPSFGSCDVLYHILATPRKSNGVDQRISDCQS